MKYLTTLAVAAGLVLAPAASRAGCGIEDAGEVNVITNFFPALELLAKTMEECRTDKLKVEVKLSTEHRVEVANAFGAAKSPYDAAHVANSSITPLQSKGELLRLNDLVAKYRDQYKLEDQMLIRFGDDIAAVAFMANAQILFYRKDLLDKYGIKVPTTYDELLAAAEKLKGDPSIDHPYAAAFASGWELGNEFVNIYLAEGGELFDPASGEAAFANEKGLKALALMKKLYGYMTPNALTVDFGGVKQQLQQGRVALAILWGDTAASMDDPKQSKVVDKIGFAPAPAVVPGGPVATTFWWDGYVIPKNLDGNADLTFRVIMWALRPEVVEKNNDVTLWLRSNYKPTRYAKAVVDSVAGGAPPYPMTAQAALAHSAIGGTIGNFLAGKQTAEQSLADAAKAYHQAAVDAGIIKK
jgi:ABC-type glycerol-3-phosphate transport system substrate-binding protein